MELDEKSFIQTNLEDSTQVRYVTDGEEDLLCTIELSSPHMKPPKVKNGKESKLDGTLLYILLLSLTLNILF